MVSGALIAYIATNEFPEHMLPIAGFIFLLGLYGIVSTQKLYERQEYHYLRARKCINKLDQLIGENELKQLIEDSYVEHYGKFKLATRFESRVVWLVLHAMIAGYSLYLMVVMKDAIACS